MDIKFYNQPKDTKIYDILSQRLKEDFNKVWICAGFVKDSAIDMLLPDIEIARKNNTIIECIFGLDNKNTSKDMLLKLLNTGCKIRYHLNDDDSKFETRAYLFERDTGDSYIYISGSKFSEGGLTDNMALIQEVSYNQSEKKEFNKARAVLESGFPDEDFEYLSEEKLIELARSGEILARITERKIPSISELYNGGNTEIGVNEYNDEDTKTDYKALVDKDIDIAFEDSESVIVQHSFGEEIEQQLKKKSKTEDKVTSKILSQEKEADFDAMTTLIIPISKANIKSDEIKLPTAVTTLMNKFFGYPDDFHAVPNEKGEIKETKEIELEIFENVGKKTLESCKGQLVVSPKFLSIKSDSLKDFEMDGEDIYRIIKNDSNKYRCEIIKNESSEHQVWSDFCTVSVKGYSKKIGVM